EPFRFEPAAVESEGNYTDHGAWRSERPKKPLSPLPTGGGLSRGRLGEIVQIPEPGSKSHEQKSSQFPEPGRQIPEPIPVQFPEPSLKPDPEPDVELGKEVDAAEALSWDRRLWNLETYGDRHGKRRLRRSLRFIGKPPVRVELGVISPELEAELRARPGRGRHKQSRAEADALRRFA